MTTFIIINMYINILIYIIQIYIYKNSSNKIKYLHSFSSRFWLKPQTMLRCVSPKHILSAVHPLRLSFPIPAGGWALLYSIGRLVKLGFFSPFPFCSRPVARHWVVTSMLYHSTWLYSNRTWHLKDTLLFQRWLTSNPLPRSLPSLSLQPVEMGTGGVVKSIIYPCLHSNLNHHPPTHHHL